SRYVGLSLGSSAAADSPSPRTHHRLSVTLRSDMAEYSTITGAAGASRGRCGTSSRLVTRIANGPVAVPGNPTSIRTHFELTPSRPGRISPYSPWALEMCAPCGGISRWRFRDRDSRVAIRITSLEDARPLNHRRALRVAGAVCSRPTCERRE